MIEFPTGTARNLQEQVAKNKQDIEDIIQGNKILSEFGISVVGSVATEADLPNPTTYAGKYGDAYTVGLTTPYDYYVFTRPTSETPEAHWFNLGQFPAVGPQGAQGEQGEQGEPGSKIYIQATNPTVVTGFNLSDLWINSSNGSLYQLTVNGWNYVGTFKGEQGAQGLQGVQGERGPRGASYSLLGVLSSTSLLPQPSSMESMQNGYLIGSQAPYNIYLITGNPDDSSTWIWQNIGSPSGGTDVQVGGVSQATWNADSKQDKDIGATGSMMASEYTNEMVRMAWSYGADSYSFAKRRDGGRLTVGTPLDESDSTTKDYVDSRVKLVDPTYNTNANITINRLNVLRTDLSTHYKFEILFRITATGAVTSGTTIIHFSSNSSFFKPNEKYQALLIKSADPNTTKMVHLDGSGDLIFFANDAMDSGQTFTCIIEYFVAK